MKINNLESIEWFNMTLKSIENSLIDLTRYIKLDIS